MKKLLLFLVILLFAIDASAATIIRPSKSFGGTSFINGVIPQASDFNGDHDTIYSEFNGNITDSNIQAGAGIAPTKINPDGFTTNLRTVNAAPCHILEESDQAADTKRWAWCLVAGQLRLSTTNDLNAVQNDWFKISRADGSTTIGGTGGSNVINGVTTFNQTVTFAGGGSTVSPVGAVTMYVGLTAPAGWLLMDGASNSCTGAAAANTPLCVQLVGLVATVNYKGTPSTTITVDTSSDEILHSAHGKSVGDAVHFDTTVTLPAPLSNSVVYCIKSTTVDRYKISTVCAGSQVDITTTGTGTHSDYFNFLTPDLRGRAAVGTGTGGGLTARVLGVTSGSEDAIVVTHSHGVTDPTHNHGVAGSYAMGPGGQTNTVGGGGSISSTTNLISASSTGITINNAGSSGTNANMPPFLVLTYIIKL